MRQVLAFFLATLFWQLVIGDDCLPLGECPSLMALLQNKDNLPNFNRVDVFNHLYQLGCGFEGNSPMVLCPPVIEDEENVPAARNILSNFDDLDTCSGSLTLIHAKYDPYRRARLSTVQTTKLRRAKYFNLQRRLLTPARILLNVKSFGNCCWKLYSQRNHRGQNLRVGLGFIGLPEFRPESVEQVPCD